MDRRLIRGLLAFVLCGVWTMNVHAATITVDTTSDAGTITGNCELREAIQAAENNAAVDGCAAGSGADTIVFAPALAGQTIAYSSDMSFASGTVTIDGQGRAIVLQASGSASALTLSGSATDPIVTIRGLDVRATGTGNGVTLITGSITIDNSSVQGRLGINAFGSSSTVTLNDSTVASTETSAASDIGVRTGVSTNLVVKNSTIAASVGYGIDVNSSTGSCSVYSSIVVGALLVHGTCSSSGGTLQKTTLANAGLDTTLTNNGGPTRTFALLSGSAIDGGDCASAADPDHDQRFYLNSSTGQRAVGAACDVGAYESGAVPAADVSITKTLQTVGPYIHGESVTYSIVVNNAGPAAATNVHVTDTPTNLTITNVSGSCSALPCTLPSLASGGNATITVTATINAQGAFNNAATVSATEYDPDSSNNSDNSNGGTASAAADVSLVKTLNTVAPYYLGKSLTYTLTVSNAGPDTATSVQVTDTPAHLAITNVSGGGCSALPCSIPSVASGAHATITVTATISAEGDFDNIASANAAQADPDSANNTDSVGNGGTTTAAADVAINETLVTPGLYFAGEAVTFTLFVSNAGPDSASAIMVSATPTNLTITNVSGAGCSALPCALSPATLAVGSNQTITVKAKINAAGAFGSNASVTAAQLDPVLANNSSNVTNTVSADEIFSDRFE